MRCLFFLTAGIYPSRRAVGGLEAPAKKWRPREHARREGVERACVV